MLPESTNKSVYLLIHFACLESAYTCSAVQGACPYVLPIAVEPIFSFVNMWLLSLLCPVVRLNLVLCPIDNSDSLVE